jgi:hypothetical protein
MITVTGTGFKSILEQNLVTIDHACQLDLTSVSDANTQLEGTLGQITTAGGGAVSAYRGVGGSLPTSTQGSGFVASTSLNVGGFTRSPSPTAEATCSTSPCDNFTLALQTPETVGNTVQATALTLDITSLGDWNGGDVGTVRVFIAGQNGVSQPATVQVKVEFEVDAGSTLTPSVAATHIANYLQKAFDDNQTLFAGPVYGLSPDVSVVALAGDVVRVSMATTSLAWGQVSKAQ